MHIELVLYVIDVEGKHDQHHRTTVYREGYMKQKDLQDMFNRAKHYEGNYPKYIITSPKVYQTFDGIVNAPWYKKLYWQLCRPFWWMQEHFEAQQTKQDK